MRWYFQTVQQVIFIDAVVNMILHANKRIFTFVSKQENFIILHMHKRFLIRILIVIKDNKFLLFSYLPF